MNPGTEGKVEIEIPKRGFSQKFSLLYPPEQIVAGQNESDLLQCIHEAYTEWVSANTNFEQAVDPDMIDYFIYKIKACEVRYQYLLKEAKEKGIKV